MNTIQNNKLDYTNQDVFVGIDVHKKSWKVSIYTKEFEHKTFTQPPDVDKLVKYIHRNFPCGNYYSVYEAGFCGFWIHYELWKRGIKNMVVNPADIPTKDKERRNKNDRVDSRKLTRELKNGGLQGIYVPTREEIEDRSLVRVREGMVRKQTRIKNQIKSMLSFYGIEIPEEMLGRHWSRRFIKWLESIKMRGASGDTSLKTLIQDLLDVRQKIAVIIKAIRKLSWTKKYKENAMLLYTIPGVGILTSMIVLLELIDINRFGTFDKLNSYAGFIPSEHSSGEEENKWEKTHRKNTLLNKTLIESSWVAIREDTGLLQQYKKYCRLMDKNKAIIKIAKKLLNRIRFVLKNKKPYVMGIV